MLGETEWRCEATSFVTQVLPRTSTIPLHYQTLQYQTLHTTYTLSPSVTHLPTHSPTQNARCVCRRMRGTLPSCNVHQRMSRLPFGGPRRRIRSGNVSATLVSPSLTISGISQRAEAEETCQRFREQPAHATVEQERIVSCLSNEHTRKGDWKE